MPVIKENVYSDLTIETLCYQKTPQKDLTMSVFKPESWTSGDRRPAILFYFGGGFYKGNPSHFRMQAEYFAHLGMVTLTPDYRLTTLPGITVKDCLLDGKSALRYVIAHAEELGIDPKRIVVAGGSAGGAMASAAAMVNTLDERDESSVPCAMILYNPGIQFSSLGSSFDGLSEEDTININGKQEKIKDLKEKMPKFDDPELETLSPMEYIRPGLPVTLLIQGEADRAVSVESIKEFQRKMRAAGNDCELVVYPDRDHGFFNWNSSEEHICYYDTLNLVEDFLRRKQILNPGLRKKLLWE